MRTLSLLLATVLAAAALAGCTGGDGDTTTTPTPSATPTVSATPATTPTSTPVLTPTVTPGTPPLDSSTYAIATAGVPTQAKPATKFNFTLYVNGSVTHNSDHIGAHFANNDTTNPPVTPGRGDCEHTGADLPGIFAVNCTLNEIGTWYVWGHARINDSGELRNWWPSTPAIVKVRDYNATLSGVPTSIQQSNATFSVTLTLNGLGVSENVSSDHIGIHYWNATEDEPSLQNAAGACEHVSGGSIGTYTIQCNIVNPGVTPKEHYLRGHLRLTDGPTVLSWWSQEYPVNIGPQVGLPI